MANIEVTKPERAKMLENILIANIQRGAIRSKLSEDELKNFLGQVNEQIAKKQTTVKVSACCVLVSKLLTLFPPSPVRSSSHGSRLGRRRRRRVVRCVCPLYL